MAGRCQMNPNLVGSSGDEIDVDEADLLLFLPLEYTTLGAGRFSFRSSGIQVPDLRIGYAPDRGFHHEGICHLRALDQGSVDLVDASVEEILGQSAPGLGRLGEQHDARGPSADPVNRCR